MNLDFQIRNKKLNKCIQVVDKDHGGKVSLSVCSHNKTNPIHQQFFTLRHYRDIMIHGKSDCLEGSAHGVNYARCHFEQGNQYFRYDLETLQIHWGRARNNLCIDAHDQSDYIFINFCDKGKETQKWIWGFARMSALKNWINFGEPIIDKQEIKDLIDPKHAEEYLPKNSSIVHGKQIKLEDFVHEDEKKDHHRAKPIKLNPMPKIPVKTIKAAHPHGHAQPQKPQAQAKPVPPQPKAAPAKPAPHAAPQPKAAPAKPAPAKPVPHAAPPKPAPAKPTPVKAAPAKPAHAAPHAAPPKPIPQAAPAPPVPPKPVPKEAPAPQAKPITHEAPPPPPPLPKAKPAPPPAPKAEEHPLPAEPHHQKPAPPQQPSPKPEMLAPKPKAEPHHESAQKSH